MRSNNAPVIHISAVDEKPDRFAAMIEHQYRTPIELCIDGPFPILSNPVRDMLQSIKRLGPVAG